MFIFLSLLQEIARTRDTDMSKVKFKFAEDCEVNMLLNLGELRAEKKEQISCRSKHGL